MDLLALIVINISFPYQQIRSTFNLFCLFPSFNVVQNNRMMSSQFISQLEPKKSKNNWEKWIYRIGGWGKLGEKTSENKRQMRRWQRTRSEIQSTLRVGRNMNGTSKTGRDETLGGEKWNAYDFFCWKLSVFRYFQSFCRFLCVEKSRGSVIFVYKTNVISVFEKKKG